MLIKADHPGTGIRDYKHKPWVPDDPAPDDPGRLWQFYTGPDGVFQGVGKDHSQLVFIRWQLRRKGYLGFHPDSPALGLGKIRGKNGVQDRGVAPPHGLNLVQTLPGNAEEIQGLPLSPLGDKR